MHFTAPLATASYNSNAIGVTAIVTPYFTIISGVTKWHAVLFKGALLINITTISMLFVFEYSSYHTRVLIKDAILIEEIQ